MKRRGLTNLERRAAELLLAEAGGVLERPSDYQLEPGYYEGTHTRRWTARDPQELGSYWFYLERRDGSEGFWFSIGFDRPRRGNPQKTWRVSVRLDGIQSIAGITRLHIAKEGYLLGHGQYLIADKENAQWRITASEYD